MRRKFPKPRKWYPKNINKYSGDVNNIILRSSWEHAFFNWCDDSDSVLSYSSEEVVIPYRCMTDNKSHKYYVDAKITVKDADNIIKTYLVEIKPYAQTIPPIYKKNKNTYLKESMTYGKNQSKWYAAENYCEIRGWGFLIITEKQLFGTNNGNKH